MILALVASGLTLIFGIMDVVNFAHGDLVMLGAFVGATTVAQHRAASGSRLLVAALTIAVFGAALQITTLRPLLGRDPLTTILATFGISLVLQKYAIWQWGPTARNILRADLRASSTLFYLQYPWYRILTAVLSAAIIGALYLFLKFGEVRDLDPRHHPGPRHGRRPWASRCPSCTPSVFAIGAGHGGGRAACSSGPLGGVTQNMGFDFTLRAFIVVVVGGMGNLGGSILAAIFISLLEAYASLVVSPAQAVIVSFVVLILTLLFRPTGLFVPTRQIAANAMAADDSHGATGSASRWSSPSSSWRPLVLPEFWRRFVTEILIWGLLAMSSDILIGYTGMVSFGHSAFFGLGMYGAAAALLTREAAQPLARRSSTGWSPPAVVAAFVAFFATRLREIYFSITTLVFSQIFYVIIFTWTEVTGGENGLTFSQPAALASRALFDVRFTPTTLHWFVLAVVALSYLLLRRITQSPFGMVLQSIRENEPRTRAIGYSRRALQDRGGDALRALRGAGRRALRDPEQVRRARLRLLRDLRRGGDLQRDGRHGHAGGARRGRGLLPPAPRGLSRYSPSTT